MTNEEVCTKAKEFLSMILENLGYEAEIESTVESDDRGELVFIKIEGDRLSDIIGFHGKHLNSLQHMTNISVNRGSEDKVRIILDINNYREKRERYLQSVAERALINVNESGQSVSLQPMKPADRRIIHISLKEEEGVETTSEGDEPGRYVVVKPL